MAIGNFGGFPSITIPCGFVNNMPIGLNITSGVKKDLDNLNINNVSFNKEDLENGLCDHILKDIIMHLEELDIIQVLVQDTSIIGSLTDNNPLTVVYSFCYIPKDIKIKYPIQKGNAYLFTTKDIDMIQTEMLIANKLYKKHKVIYSTEFSDLLFSYMLFIDKCQ